MKEGSLDIVVGSKKPFKIDFAREFFVKEFKTMPVTSEGVEVDTGVADQPLTKDDTEQGARNRSRAVLDKGKADFGIGLEGGVFEDTETGKFYLIEAAGITIRTGNPTTTSGVSDSIQLPDEIAEELRAGKLLSTAIQEYLRSQGQEVSIPEIQVNGTAFYVTDEKISRKSMMMQALQRAMKKLDQELNAQEDEQKK